MWQPFWKGKQCPLKVNTLIAQIFLIIRNLDEGECMSALKCLCSLPNATKPLFLFLKYLWFCSVLKKVY